MIVVTRGAELMLRAADDCKAFHVESDRDAHGLDILLRDQRAGYAAGDHAWISVSWVRSTVGAGGEAIVSDDWAKRFEGMIDYAHIRGWLDDAAKHIRAHIDLGAPSPGV